MKIGKVLGKNFIRIDGLMRIVCVEWIELKYMWSVLDGDWKGVGWRLHKNGRSDEDCLCVMNGIKIHNIWSVFDEDCIRFEKI